MAIVLAKYMHDGKLIAVPSTVNIVLHFTETEKCYDAINQIY